MRRAKCYADFRVMPKSRYRFILHVSLIPVESRYVASIHTCAPKFEPCMTVPVR